MRCLGLRGNIRLMTCVPPLFSLDLWSLLEKRIKSRLSNKAVIFTHQPLINIIKVSG